MIWVVQEWIYHEIKEAKPQKLAYGMVVYDDGCPTDYNPPVYIDAGQGQGYTESVTMVGDLEYPHAQLAFHAKESPIRTRDEVFNLVSSWSWSPAEGIVRLSEHPIIHDSLKEKASHQLGV